MRSTLLSMILAPVLLTGCGSAVINPVTGQSERSVMNEESEIAEGKKAHEQVLQEYGVVKNARLQAYVNDLGQRLAKQSHQCLCTARRLCVRHAWHSGLHGRRG